MQLFPKSSKDWIRSLALSLFASCVTVGLVVLWGGMGFTHNRAWRYAGPSIGLLFSSLGFALGAICLFGGPALDKGFQRLGLIVAVVSVALGLLSLPALAE